MALLGAFVDSRTNAVIAAAGSTSFAHGLPADPNLIVVQENTTTNSTTNCKLAVKHDATNVSIYNHGAGQSATLRIVSQVFHSLVK